MSGDAFHITAPPEDGDGAFRCMSAAIKRAGIAPATSTTSTRTAPRPWRTRSSSARCSARRQRRRQNLDVLDQIVDRHLLGAAGAVEAIFCDSGDPRPGRAADHQSRQSLGRDPDRPRAPQARKRESM
jgi:3-oxoacyl-[acyl-carrier-protein] synthase II